MDLEHHFDDTHLSLMERKSWKNRDGRRLPKRFRDLLPEPSTLAPPAPSASTLSSSSHASEPSNVTGHHAVTTGIRRAACRINEFFTTQRNKFNLFRRYTTGSPPSHDPEDDAMADDLCEDHDEAGRSDPSPAQLYPYPNRNSLLLGDWYWNGGAQKSQTSFKDLLDIVGDPDFNPTDVRHTKWDTINRVLADGRNWVDEDAGWEKTTISISVPFQSRRGASDSTGTPKEFLFTDFYHRNLVSVIKEKLSNARDDNQFHYDPYELNFQPDGSPRPIRVHGELYTSPAFLDEHKALQELPPEPGCSLPRCVVGIMFCSDSTQLASFGDTSLWPLYMFFGNESKYRRCKPSCHLGNHVAYFHRVSGLLFELSIVI